MVASRFMVGRIGNPSHAANQPAAGSLSSPPV